MVLAQTVQKRLQDRDCAMISQWNVFTFTLDHPAVVIPVSCLAPGFLIALGQIPVWGMLSGNFAVDGPSRWTLTALLVASISDVIFGTDPFPCAAPQEFFPRRLASC